MQPSRRVVTYPAGLSFDIPDLLMLRAWADYHDLHMGLALDTVIAGAVYEEFVTLTDARRTDGRWGLWRSADGIVLQGMAGAPRLFATMADALELLIPTTD